MITVREWSRLRIGWPSTFGGLCSCSLPGEAGGRHIQYHGTLLQAAGVAGRRPCE